MNIAGFVKAMTHNGDVGIAQKKLHSKNEIDRSNLCSVPASGSGAREHSALLQVFRQASGGSKKTCFQGKKQNL